MSRQRTMKRGETLPALDDDSDAPLDLLLDDGDREDEANEETGEAEAPAAPSPPRSTARRRPR